MRKIELVWKDAQWAPGIGERIVDEILTALEAERTTEPDEVYLVREGDPRYPDSRSGLLPRLVHFGWSAAHGPKEET